MKVYCPEGKETFDDDETTEEAPPQWRSQMRSGRSLVATLVVATAAARAAADDGTRPAGTIYFERNGNVRSTTREWAFAAAARELEKFCVMSVVEEGVRRPDSREHSPLATAAAGRRPSC